MGFWDIEGLKDSLLKGDLTEKRQCEYLFCFVMIYSIPVQLGYVFPNQNSVEYWDYFNAVSEITAAIIGFFLIYHVNGGSKGINFISRFIPISFVLLIRVFVPSIFLVIIALAFFEDSLMNNGMENAQFYSKLADAIGTIGCYILYYWRFYIHMNDLKVRSR